MHVKEVATWMPMESGQVLVCIFFLRKIIKALIFAHPGSMMSRVVSLYNLFLKIAIHFVLCYNF